jgi:DNA-binding response OmpR family regulator/predicted  nucleic acid-binding Zn-ribbon protein
MNPKVLLLEDDASHATELSQAFVNRNWDVTIGRDADEGFAMATRARYDLIVLSAELPGDGAAVCKRLKSDPTAGRVPVFMVSRNGAKPDIEVEGFFAKPVAVSHLLAQLPLAEAKGSAGVTTSTEQVDLGDADIVGAVEVAPPPRPSKPSMAPSMPPPDVLKNLRADLSARSAEIAKLEQKRKTLEAEIAELKKRTEEAEITAREGIIAKTEKDDAVKRVEEALKLLEQRELELAKAREALAVASIDRANEAAQVAHDRAALELRHSEELEAAKRTAAAALAAREDAFGAETSELVNEHSEAMAAAAKRVEELETRLRDERERHAQELDEHVTGVVAEKGLVADTLAARVKRHAEELLERDKAWSDKVEALDAAHEKALAERDREMAAEGEAAAQELLITAQRLAAERKARADDAAAHAQTVAALETKAASELETTLRAHADAVAARDHAHDEALTAQTLKVEDAAIALTSARAKHQAELEKLERALTEAESKARSAPVLEERVRAHEEAMAALRREHERALSAGDRALVERDAVHQATIDAHAADLAQRAEAHAQELTERVRVHAEAIVALKAMVRDLETLLGAERDAFNAELAGAQAEMVAVVDEQARTLEAKEEEHYAALTAREHAVAKERAAFAAEHVAALEEQARRYQEKIREQEIAYRDGSAEARETLSAAAAQHDEVAGRLDDALHELERRQRDLARALSDLATERGARTADARRHAGELVARDEALAEERARLDERIAGAVDQQVRAHQSEIEDLKRAHADEYAERVQVQNAALAEIEHANEEAIDAERRRHAAVVESHARELEERDGAASTAASSAAARILELEELLAAEIDGRAADGESYKLTLAAEKMAVGEELAEVQHDLAGAWDARVADAARHASEKRDLEEAHARERVEAAQRHEVELEALEQRLGDVEELLATERGALAASVAAHARDFAGAKKLREDAIAERDRAHAKAQAERDRVHASSLAERDRMLASASEGWPERVDALTRRLEDAERALAQERKARATEAATHARELAAAARNLEAQREAAAADMRLADHRAKRSLGAAQAAAVKAEGFRDAALDELRRELDRANDRIAELSSALADTQAVRRK